jgi:hypothetical protein
MLAVHGGADQLARFLPALAGGEEMRCQLFSEPGSGSDLASAQAGAVRPSPADGPGETQRGIAGERVPGLPAAPRTDRAVPFRDLTIGTQRPGS